MGEDQVTGKIYIVGAGPGDPSLLTVRAMQLIRTADVVSYDCFVSDQIVASIPKDKVTFDCERQAKGQASDRADASMAPLIEQARQGKNAVRLKGGDPWVFGRGDLEMQACVDAGIPVETVPGVSAASACFTVFGIPITQKGISNALEIRSANGPNPAGDVCFSADKTLVYMMADISPNKLADELIAAGFPAQTPACVVSRGTYADQQAAFADLGKVASTIKGMPSPLIMAVGANLDPKYRIRTTPDADVGSADTAMLDLMVRGLAEFDWVIPASEKAAYAFVNRARANTAVFANLEGLRTGAITESIAAIMREAGLLRIHRLDISEDSRLLDGITDSGRLVGGRFLVLHSSPGKPGWASAISRAGGIVVAIETPTTPGRRDNENIEEESGPVTKHM